MSVAFGIGSDPEFFARDRNSLDLVSSVGLISGVQKKKVACNGGYLQEDNVAFEINPDPANSFEEWYKNTTKCFKSLEEFLNKKDLIFVWEPSAQFPEKLLKCKEAGEIGCEPEMNAWSMEICPSPSLYLLGNTRTSGGHIAVSFDCGNDPYPRINLVRNMDMLIGSILAQYEPASNRRDFYGQAGAHRPKFLKRKDEFDGVEYRVLSNWWVGRKEIMRYIFNTVQYCLDNEEQLSIEALANKDQIIQAIHEPGGFESLYITNVVREINPHYNTFIGEFKSDFRFI